jgi:Fe-S-cluster-containing hydrogenase component 2
MIKLMDFLRGGRDRERALEAISPHCRAQGVKCDLCAGYDDYACVSACPVGAAYPRRPAEDPRR